MIDMRIKHLFFDRQAVVRAVDKARRDALSKAGAFTRTTARFSICSRKGAAPPGQPPNSHEGSLRWLILFGYDKSSDSVVVSPMGFRKSVDANVLNYDGDAVARRRRGD